MAAALTSDGLEVDHWPLPLADLMAAHDFPGSEVERTEAWGLVGRLPGSGDGPSLMLNGHVDVVPEGDLGAWTGRDAVSGRIVDGALHGRGACDMKAGVVRSEAHTSELQSLMRISYAVFCLKNNKLANSHKHT